MTRPRALITGASSGLGRGYALNRAPDRYDLVLVARDEDRLRELAGIIEAENGTHAEVVVADLSTRSGIAEVRTVIETSRIDLLINNAGIMIPPLSHTIDGFESQFGTNHLGHFALTNLLLPQIRDRVVTLSSLAHKSGYIEFEDLDWTRRPYKPMAAYGQSKIANLLFTSELQRRLSEKSSPVIATAAHPGLATTNLFKASDGNRLRAAVSRTFIGLIGQNEQEGARPTLCAAVADIPGDSFVGPKSLFEVRGAPGFASRAPGAKNAEVARRLWTVSEELTEVTFPLSAL